MLPDPDVSFRYAHLSCASLSRRDSVLTSMAHNNVCAFQQRVHLDRVACVPQRSDADVASSSCRIRDLSAASVDWNLSRPRLDRDACYS